MVEGSSQHAMAQEALALLGEEAERGGPSTPPAAAEGAAEQHDGRVLLPPIENPPPAPSTAGAAGGSGAPTAMLRSGSPTGGAAKTVRVATQPTAVRYSPTPDEEAEALAQAGLVTRNDI